MKTSKGLVIIYTGEGKGKTTAALGLILRASGYNKKILLVQFIKNSFSGELKSLKKFKNLKIIQGGKGFVGILEDKLPFEEHKKSALETFEKLKKEMESGDWDLIVADEIIGAISGKLISLEEMINLISTKPQEVDLVLIGRGASKELIELADLVTEMKEIKHPFKKRVLAKKGIDY